MVRVVSPRFPGDRQHAVNAIYQYKFDAGTGRPTPNDPMVVPQDEEVGPRHYRFHPSKDLVYVSNEQGGSVTVYALDTARGTLSAVQTVTTLPEDYVGDTSHVLRYRCTPRYKSLRRKQRS
ncbi:MAG: hypothetical protein CM1200mP22_29950 [Dehalococcoidia bacterium]|nr:MAG: hypothetical protein CM1200mP22_29950 [Dehalococcoidia bacterium]